MQITDLAVSEEDLMDECAEIERRIGVLNAEKQAVDDLLNNELKPKAQSLKFTLAEYRKAMEAQDELEFISKLETSMKGELFAAETEDEESEIEFRRRLKNSDMTNCEGFFRQSRHFSAGILAVFQGEITMNGGKLNRNWAY
jgi:hypothetical protein